MRVQMRPGKHIHVQKHIHTYIYIHMHLYIRTYAYICSMCIAIFTCVCIICYTCSHTHTYIHIWYPPMNPRLVMVVWSSPTKTVLPALLVGFRIKGLGLPAVWFRVRGLGFYNFLYSRV